MSEVITIEARDGVAHVTLNRPDVHNAFDEATIAALTRAWDEIRGRADIQAVILRGNGKSFSAGGDLGWMKRAAGHTKKQNYNDAMGLAMMLNGLYTLPQLTIASVHGAAMGGGFGLVACCDIVVAEEETTFSLSEVKLGLIPATIGPYVVRAIGERQAKRYFQTGERFKGVRAREIGLVHELVQNEAEREGRVLAILDSIKSNGPDAMRAAKRLCLDLAGQPLTPRLIRETAKRIAQTRAGGEAIEGLSAFLEKRKASWSKQ